MGKGGSGRVGGEGRERESVGVRERECGSERERVWE